MTPEQEKRLAALWDFREKYINLPMITPEEYARVWADIKRNHGIGLASPPSPAPSPLPYGAEIVQAEDGHWDVRANGNWLWHSARGWSIRNVPGDTVGQFDTRAEAESALRSAPPPPGYVAPKFPPSSPESPLRGRERWFVTTTYRNNHRKGTHRCWRFNTPNGDRFLLDGKDTEPAVRSLAYYLSEVAAGRMLELDPATGEEVNADYELLTLCAVRYNSIKGYLIPDDSIEAILDNEIRGRIKARLADAATKERGQ